MGFCFSGFVQEMWSATANHALSHPRMTWQSFFQPGSRHPNPPTLWHLHLAGNQICEWSILVTCEWMICIEVLFHSRPQPISHLDPREIYTWISPKFMLIKGIFFAGYTVGTEANCSQFLCCRPGTYRFEIPYFFCILKTAAEVYITKIQRMGKKNGCEITMKPKFFSLP